VSYALRVAMTDDDFMRSSFSQEGEDVLLLRLLGFKGDGFYVDVGAHHPRRFSNTFMFYCMGWQGINIDPRPGCMAEFNRMRPRDVNLEIAISDRPGQFQYYEFDAPELNGFSREPIVPPGHAGRFKLLAEHTVIARPLADVLSEHVPAGTPIDFLTVDVEGHDLEVLRSSDWTRFRPRLVLAEATGLTLEEASRGPAVDFMSGSEYVAVSKTVNSIFFAEREWWSKKARGDES
jgi:FkbM family methyltransferase